MFLGATKGLPSGQHACSLHLRRASCLHTPTSAAPWQHSIPTKPEPLMPDAAAPGPLPRRPQRRWPAPALLGSLLVASGIQAQPGDPGAYLRQMDSDGDGRISQTEYVEWMLYAFQRMDRDGDGVLQGNELPGGRGSPIRLEQHRQVLCRRFQLQDRNHDGWLDAAELAAPPR